MSTFRSFTKKLNVIGVSLLLVAAQILPFAAVMAVNTEIAGALVQCQDDIQGANDQPGQKDLTQFCLDDASNDPLKVSWSWDETAWSGSNTGDACALFDTNSDGYVNYAVCVTVGNDPAVQQSNSPRIYSCNNTRIDRCAGDALVSGPYSTTCSVSIAATNPFDGSNDTTASCSIALSEVGAGSAKLVDTCSFPSQQPNSDPSDCIIYVDKSVKIEVIKKLDPTLDPGLFDLKINGTTHATDVGHNGSTGQQLLTFTGSSASITVLEAEGSGTDLASYNTTVVCRDGNGTGTILGQGNPTGSDTRQLTISGVAFGSDVVCVFTNVKKEGKITLIKNVINDNGGNASANDFGISIGGTSVDSGETLTLSPGPYEINEVGLTGYSFVSITGADCPASLGGDVNLSDGDDITCTITNNDVAPTLKLVKDVTNDNGGQADPDEWDLTARRLCFNGDTNPDCGFTDDGDSTTFHTVKAGTPYNLTESGPNGYDMTGWQCDGGTLVGNKVTLGLDEDVTCTVYNDDIAPTLQLRKIANNDDGGTDTAENWTLKAGNLISEKGTLDSNNGEISQATTKAYTAEAGLAYALSESGPVGYGVAKDWECDGGTLVNNSITLGLDEDVVCTIINDDIAPKIDLVKLVINDDGGLEIASAWTLIAQAGNDTPIINEQGTVDPQDNLKATTNTVDAEAGIFYTLSESGPDGYDDSDWVCSGTGGTQVNSTIKLALAATVTCTITNDDTAPQLKLVKEVTNDNGGTTSPSDWTLRARKLCAINDTNPDCGFTAAGDSDTFHEILANTNYTLFESGPDGYSASSWDCDGGKLVGNRITLANDTKVTCTITNNDVAPTLKLVKDVTNDNGGQADPDEWDLTARRLCFNGDTNPDCGFTDDGDSTTFHTVKAGTPYNLTESGPNGYDMTGWQCDGGTLVGNKVTLGLDEDVTCTVYNDDIAPTVTLIKEVINDNSGTAIPDDFGLTVDGVAVKSGETNSFAANKFLELNESQLSGYVFVSITGDRGCPYYPGESVYLQPGDNITCTITNNDIPNPSINVVKKGPDSASAGDTVSYMFTVTNTGDVALSNVTIKDSITGDATYVSGDINTDDMLDLDETWIYSAQYTIPDRQVQPVENTVTACGYSEYNVIELNDDNQYVDEPMYSEKTIEQNVCDTDDHTLTIPQVLAETTLVDTGSVALLSLMTGMFVISSVGVLFAINKIDN